MIEGTVRMWREHGEWRIIIEAERWVLVEIADELRENGPLVQLNGPSLDGGQNITEQRSTMLLGRFVKKEFIPPPPAPTPAPYGPDEMPGKVASSAKNADNKNEGPFGGKWASYDPIDTVDK